MERNITTPKLVAGTKPLYMQLLHELENMILFGTHKDGEKIPSSIALSQGYSINVATVQRSIQILVRKGILEKRRGIGVFVCSGAFQAIYKERKAQLYDNYVLPLVLEAGKLGISDKELIELIDRTNL